MSTTLLELFVPGIPQPSGSKKGFVVRSKGTGKMRAVIVDDAKRSRPWKSQISAMVADAWLGSPLDEPVSLALAFTMPRPKSHYWTGKRAGELRPTAPRWHTSKPDATKLLRCAEDAIVGIVLHDDACVVESFVRKEYGERPGASLVVKRADP